MPKKFYTERDIEDMAARGEFSLAMDENVVLTEMAFEKAERLGVKLLQPHQLPPAAPVRPYLSQTVTPIEPCDFSGSESAKVEDLRQRIRDAVKNKLGNQVDDALLETIITRVLNNVGMK